MAGNRGYALKRYVIDQIALLPAFAHPDTQVAYTWPGRNVGREVLFGGKVSGVMAPAAMRGSGQLQPRTEQLTLALHVYVETPGEEDCAATEARAVELGTAVEEWIAGNPVPPIEGMKSLWVASYDVESGVEDEASITGIDYILSALSYLT